MSDLNLMQAVDIISQYFAKDENKDTEDYYYWSHIAEEIVIDYVGYSGYSVAREPCYDCGELFVCNPKFDCIPF